MKLKVADFSANSKKDIELRMGDIFKFKEGTEFYIMSESKSYCQLTGVGAGRVFDDITIELSDVELVEATLNVEAFV